jgi:hypothetical protein
VVSAEAQGEPDTVVLKGGAILRGTILRVVEGEVVVIETAKGREFIRWREVEEVARGDGARGQKPRLELTRKSAMLTVDLDESEERRQAWKRRGGVLPSFELRAIGTGVIFPERQVSLTATCTSLTSASSGGTTRSSSVQDWAAGGGIGGRIGLLFLKTPTPGESSGLFALRLGSGIDASFLSLSQTTTSTQTHRTENSFCVSQAYSSETYTSGTMQLPLNVGLSFGLGGFGGSDSWHGVVVGLSYAPSYSYSFGPQGGTGSFNHLGFEVTLDITSVEALVDRLARQAQFRVSGFFLPPIKQDFPWVFSLGLGAVWY